MSTRANIIVKDSHDELIFYRHSDGYPEGTLPTLEKFLDYVRERRIRNNVEQAAGWLILIGADEYRVDYKGDAHDPLVPGHDIAVSGWKCGAYEPSVEIHGDIAYLYVVDLEAKTIQIDGQEGFAYKGKYRKG